MKILAALLCLTAFATSAQADSRYRTTATIGPVTEVVVLDELHMLETDVYRLAIADSGRAGAFSVESSASARCFFGRTNRSRRSGCR